MSAVALNACIKHFIFVEKRADFNFLFRTFRPAAIISLPSSALSLLQYALFRNAITKATQ